MLLSRILTEARLIEADDPIQRIEAIPNWKKLNFLVSLHQWLKAGRRASEKQLAALASIEQKAKGWGGSSGAGGGSSPKANVVLDRNNVAGGKEHPANIILRALHSTSPITVDDRVGWIDYFGVHKLEDFIRNEVLHHHDEEYDDAYPVHAMPDDEQEVYHLMSSYMEKHLRLQARKVSGGIWQLSLPEPIHDMNRTAERMARQGVKHRPSKGGRTSR